MIQIISISVLAASFLVMAKIFFNKIPVLAELPEKKRSEKSSLLERLKRKIKSTKLFKDFSWEGFLQKALSKMRIATLKIENKISGYIRTLRERSQKK